MSGSSFGEGLARLANLVFTALFVLSTAVQYNDPDPLRWMAVYGAAAGACVAWERRALPRVVAAGIGLVALGWAAASAAATHLTAPVGDALVDWHMHAGGSEELRETLGLAIVAGWMAVLAARARRG